MLGTKTIKCMQNILFGVIKRFYQKRVIWVFFFYIKTLITMENTIHGKIKHYQKRVFLRVFELITYEIAKKLQNNIYGLLSVFELERYQNAKMHANYLIF